MRTTSKKGYINKLDKMMGHAKLQEWVAFWTKMLSKFSHMSKSNERKCNKENYKSFRLAM